MRIKHILFAFITVFFIACGPSRQEQEEDLIRKQAKFHKGDIVYVKPDSTKAVIANVEYDCGCLGDRGKGLYYTILSGGQQSSIAQELIYEPIKTETNE